MSDHGTQPEIYESDRQPAEPRRRSRASKFLEFLFWIALAFFTAWVLVQNIETILPANSF
jgi:hypothetical protein